MAHTDKLLDLIGEFPNAFDHPEGVVPEDQDTQDSAADPAPTRDEPAPASNDLESSAALADEQSGSSETWNSILQDLGSMEQTVPEPSAVVSSEVPSPESTSPWKQGSPPIQDREETYTEPIEPDPLKELAHSPTITVPEPVAPDFAEALESTAIPPETPDLIDVPVAKEESTGDEAQPADTPDPAVPAEIAAATVASGEDIPAAQPASYTQALQRRISTFTWGTIEVYLTYDNRGLQSVWITVGKSGTEVQSLCEAIARLVNLLLAKQTPISDIVQQLRGIRGADAEGLGPNRILGLADLIGKVVQDAPLSLADAGDPLGPAPMETSDQRPQTEGGEESTPTGWESQDKRASLEGGSAAGGLPQQSVWTSLPQDTHTAGVCPACGAELQIMNGCSGGACMVCGYSSCS